MNIPCTLNDTILKYSNQGNIMIVGDLNARIGVGHRESTHETSVIDGLCPDEFMSSSVTNLRVSCDDKVNVCGKKLLELTHAFNLKFANGSVPGYRPVMPIGGLVWLIMLFVMII